MTPAADSMRSGMARAWIEPADTAWGPLQILAGQLRQLGYGVDKAGAGDRWRLLLTTSG
jgi:hypothetical protein